MDADDRAERPASRVEHVPVDDLAARGGESHAARPRRVESPSSKLFSGRRERRRVRWSVAHPESTGYQSSSVAEQLSPDPMPMSSTRSPADSSSAIVESVYGTAAGPMLPKRG